MRFLLYVTQNYAFMMLRPLQKALLKNKHEVSWFAPGANVETGYFKDEEHQLKTAEDVVKWQPDVIIAPGNFIPQFLPGIKVGVFHGFNIAKSTRSDSRGHFNIRGCFDLYCTQGPATTDPFKVLAQKHGHFSVKETGWPTLDPLFQSDDKAQNKSSKPTILYCSTFTPELTSAPHLKESILHFSQQGDYQWVVQFHPKMDPRIIQEYKALENDNLTFVETDDVIPLLKQADVMLCDTSSMIPMFLVQQKPVVTFRNQTRGSTPYLINIQEPHQLQEAIKQALNPPDSLLKEIKAYTDFIHPYCDGESASRVIQAIENFLETREYKHLKKKPLNLIRNFKERKKLSYWGF